MTLRRLALVTTILGGLCVWGLARSDDSPAPGIEPVRAEAAHGAGNHDEAAARYRASQASHWRHVAIGNHTCDR
jgi:hypothetical protein